MYFTADPKINITGGLTINMGSLFTVMSETTMLAIIIIQAQYLLVTVYMKQIIDTAAEVHGFY